MKSVGGHLSRRFCEFGVFCGRISHSRWRGYGKMPYPPKEKSVGGHLSRRFCEFGVFRGRIEYPIASGVGMARCHTLLRRNLWEDT